MSGPLAGRTAVVTGASAGIGRELAQLLHARGARVLVTGRDRERTASVADDLGSPLLLADNQHLETVAALAHRIRAEVDHIDLLFSNAGAAVTDQRPTGDGNEPNYQVNALAPLLLERLLAPALTAASAARIISTTSDLHRRATLTPGHVAAQLQDTAPGATQRYSRAKLAALVAHAATRTEPDSTPITDVHPGIVASDFGRYMGRLGSAVTALAAPFLTSPRAAAEILATVATDRDDEQPYRHRRTPRDPAAVVADRGVRDEVARHVDARLDPWLPST